VPTSFDDRARTWDDDPAKVERARVVAEAIRARVPLAPSTRMLEYGAGTGLVAQALAPHVGAITLAEPSAGMREVMTEKVAAGTLPADASIWSLDLLSDEVPDERFDLIATVMTLHHVDDVAAALRGFAALLADEGHLCIVDLEAEDGSFHRDDADFDGHDGFDREDLGALLRACGFGDVRFERCHEVRKEHGTFPLFLATTTLAAG
jgi:ubiquinone/menaquinone biosynthesis C-methylase UbiE